MADRSGTLYLVGTPIGNLEDMGDRARRVLGSVGLVAAEDTRRTGKLLARFGIDARMISFFEGNERSRVPELMEVLRRGTDVALVSDAGMPGLSDPGYRLVNACVEEGIGVDVVPGPSAAVAALVVSGLPTDRFVFEGFLPRTGKDRALRLEELARERRTIVLFESPRRVGRTLTDLLEALGDRRAAVARELTKLHQEVIRGTLSSVLGEVEGRELKGEIVIVVEGRADPPRSGDLAEAVRLAASFVEFGARKREASRRAAQATGVAAGAIYDALSRYGADAGSIISSGGRRADSSE
ncbi:MAG: 16S rRNA (cytidine(1402)-2'-O)-methyltransferase [Actinobacteria bacterium]|nr:MAG: 16S rRNA (cytidine(1402)-2'-O)-methyltransferase [Actinomycetota bacterium]